MKKTLIILAVLAMAVGLTAQVRTGNIYGKITDSENNPLPGVTVTLTGPALAAMNTVTSDMGMYRFPSISPGNEYAIHAGGKGGLHMGALQVSHDEAPESAGELPLGSWEDWLTDVDLGDSKAQ